MTVNKYDGEPGVLDDFVSYCYSIFCICKIKEKTYGFLANTVRDYSQYDKCFFATLFLSKPGVRLIVIWIHIYSWRLYLVIVDIH